MDLDLNPWASRVDTSGAQFHVTCSAHRALLDCEGELDIAEAQRLTPIVHRLEQLPTPVDVFMGGVLFADSYGVEPLFASARRRVSAGLPPLRLARISRPVGRLLDLLGVDPGEPLDLTAWTAEHEPV